MYVCVSSKSCKILFTASMSSEHHTFIVEASSTSGLWNEWTMITTMSLCVTGKLFTSEVL